MPERQTMGEEIKSELFDRWIKHGIDRMDYATRQDEVVKILQEEMKKQYFINFISRCAIKATKQYGLKILAGIALAVGGAIVSNWSGFVEFAKASIFHIK